MLDHMELYNYGEKIRNAIFETIEKRQNLTRDLKGSGSTTKFTESVCRNIELSGKAATKTYSTSSKAKEDKTEEKAE